MSVRDEKEVSRCIGNDEKWWRDCAELGAKPRRQRLKSVCNLQKVWHGKLPCSHCDMKKFSKVYEWKAIPGHPSMPLLCWDSFVWHWPIFGGCDHDKAERIAEYWKRIREAVAANNVDLPAYLAISKWYDKGSFFKDFLTEVEPDAERD